MERIRFALIALPALAVAPNAHAYYLSGYGGGSGHYLSGYSGGGNRYYNPHGHYVSKIGGSAGVGSVDRSGAHPQVHRIIVPVASTAPCGNYQRQPENCKNSTMAYNPNATVSRTGRRFNVPLLNKTYYIGRPTFMGLNNWVTPQTVSTPDYLLYY